VADTALLFRRDTVVEIEDWGNGRRPRLPRSSVLWIDLESPTDAEIRRLGETLALRDRSVTAMLSDDRREPELADEGGYVHVRLYAADDHADLTRVVCLVSERWVATVHEGSLDALETFRERACGSGDIGRLDGPEFLADLAEWVLASYFAAFERIELELEEIDTSAMSGELTSKDDVIVQLVDVRRRIGRLRRALTSHREPILALTKPELGAISSSSSAERFARLQQRLEDGVQVARDSRASVVGSFDVIIASTGQRTNEIMKILTLVSVLILPGTLLAGIMGMNFKLGIFDNTAFFWLVLVVIAAFAALALAVARLRDWL
jgi:magnesium transporter